MFSTRKNTPFWNFTFLWRSNSPTPSQKMRRCGRLSWSNMAWRIVWPIPLLRGLAMGSRVAAVWVQPWSIAWGSSCTKRPLPKTKPWNSTMELLGCWNYCNGMVWSQKGGTTRISRAKKGNDSSCEGWPFKHGRDCYLVLVLIWPLRSKVYHCEMFCCLPGNEKMLGVKWSAEQVRSSARKDWESLGMAWLKSHEGTCIKVLWRDFKDIDCRNQEWFPTCPLISWLDLAPGGCDQDMLGGHEELDVRTPWSLDDMLFIWGADSWRFATTKKML